MYYWLLKYVTITSGHGEYQNLNQLQTFFNPVAKSTKIPVYMQSKKFTLIYVLFPLLFGGALLTSFSNNPPNGRTGAPSDGQCTDCHSAGNPLGLDGTLTIDGFPDDITPGETYPITVTARNDNGLAQRNGFQAVFLDGDDNNSGDIIVAGSNPTTESSNGREYVEHRPSVDFADNIVSWSFDWVAPDDVGSEVTLYVASIIGSGTAGNGSDLLVEENSTGTIMTPTATHDLIDLADIAIYPNPASDRFTVELTGSLDTEIDLTLVSVTGKSVFQQQNAVRGNNRLDISVAGLPAGIYFLNVKSEKGNLTKRVVVQ